MDSVQRFGRRAPAIQPEAGPRRIARIAIIANAAEPQRKKQLEPDGRADDDVGMSSSSAAPRLFLVASAV